MSAKKGQTFNRYREETKKEAVRLRVEEGCYSAYFYLGSMIEHGETEHIFTNPDNRLTQEYIMGRFG